MIRDEAFTDARGGATTTPESTPESETDARRAPSFKDESRVGSDERFR